MVDGVHGNTTSLGPRVALDGELMLGARGLEERLVGTAAAGDDADHAAGAAQDDLLGARGQLDTGLALIGVVSDDGDVVAGGAAQGAAVANLLLNVGHDGTLGHGAQGQNVADGEGGLLAGVDELAGVHALVGDEGLGVLLELVGVAENNLGEGRATAGVVNDLLHDAADVALTLGIVEVAELGRSLWCCVRKKIVRLGFSRFRPSVASHLVEAGVGRENRATALSLVADLEKSIPVSTPYVLAISYRRRVRLRGSRGTLKNCRVKCTAAAAAAGTPGIIQCSR